MVARRIAEYARRREREHGGGDSLGPFRRSGSPGCYVLDPRAQKLRHYVTPGYGNPWCYAYNWWGQGIVGDGTPRNNTGTHR